MCRFGWLLAALLTLAGTAASADLTSLREQALDLVNQDRAERQLPPLRPDPGLDRAAQGHAEDMARRHYDAHSSPEGRTPVDRYVAAGGSRAHIVAENIARCEACRPPADRAVLLELQRGWMASPGHRDNILAGGTTQFGFGLVLTPADGLYAVQTFAGPGEEPGGDAGPPLTSADAQTTKAAELLGHARQRAGSPGLQPSPALGRAAAEHLAKVADAMTLPDTAGLPGAVAEEQAGRWRLVTSVAGQCRGCGAEATAGDVAFFVDGWLGDPQYREILVDPRLTQIGFAMRADGQGRKIALAILAGLP